MDHGVLVEVFVECLFYILSIISLFRWSEIASSLLGVLSIFQHTHEFVEVLMRMV